MSKYKPIGTRNKNLPARVFSEWNDNGQVSTPARFFVRFSSEACPFGFEEQLEVGDECGSKLFQGNGADFIAFFDGTPRGVYTRCSISNNCADF